MYLYSLAETGKAFDTVCIMAKYDTMHYGSDSLEGQARQQEVGWVINIFAI